MCDSTQMSQEKPIMQHEQNICEAEQPACCASVSFHGAQAIQTTVTSSPQLWRRAQWRGGEVICQALMQVASAPMRPCLFT